MDIVNDIHISFM